MKYPHVRQHDEKDCGAACLSMICEYHKLKMPITRLRELIKVDNLGSNIYGILKGAEKLGLDGTPLEGNQNDLIKGLENQEVEFPFIARIINEEMYEHFVVVYGIKNNKIYIGDPAKSENTKLPLEYFFQCWQQQIIVFKPNANFKTGNKRKNSFRKFFKYITSQKKFLALVFVLSIFITAINFSGITVFQYVIDNSLYDETLIEMNEASHGHDHSGEEDHDDEEVEEDELEVEQLSGFESALEGIESKLDVVFRNINTVCITIIFMYLFQMLMEILRGYILALTAKKVDLSLTLDYYNHLVDLPVNFYGTRKTGEFMSRFGDTDNIREAISTTTLTIMLDTIMAIACGALLFRINKQLFLITLTVIALYTIVMFAFKKPIKNISFKTMEQGAQVTSYLKESIDGIETIKAYRHEGAAKKKTQKLYNDLLNKSVKANIIYLFQESLVSVIESIGIVVLLWSGAVLCGKSIITLTELFIFYYLINYFLDPVKNLINLQPELQTAMVAAERLNDILDVEIENNYKEKVDKLKGDIVCKDIDFRYGYRNLVLKDVSMTFKSGTKTAIVGESGCGKTTLAKLIMQFYTPEKGSITVNGTNLADASQESVRQRISYISQDIFLFSDTVYNNLRIGNSQITDEEITEMCKKCGADEFINNLPMGYKTVLEENGNNLSGGQKQRLAIARALLKKPDILIMDEATSNLDTVTEQSIKNLIDSLSEEITCIIIAHRLTTIKSCDYIYVMDKGTVVESGTHQELLEKNGMYKQLTDNI